MDSDCCMRISSRRWIINTHSSRNKIIYYMQINIVFFYNYELNEGHAKELSVNYFLFMWHSLEKWKKHIILFLYFSEYIASNILLFLPNFQLNFNFNINFKCGLKFDNIDYSYDYIFDLIFIRVTCVIKDKIIFW